MFPTCARDGKEEERGRETKDKTAKTYVIGIITLKARKNTTVYRLQGKQQSNVSVTAVNLYLVEYSVAGVKPEIN
jgi:hypothetical protein